MSEPMDRTETAKAVALMDRARISRKRYLRVREAGLDEDDVEQEAVIAGLLAQRSFDATRGRNLASHLFQAMTCEVIQSARKIHRRRANQENLTCAVSQQNLLIRRESAIDADLTVWVGNLRRELAKLPAPPAACRPRRFEACSLLAAAALRHKMGWGWSRLRQALGADVELCRACGFWGDIPSRRHLAMGDRLRRTVARLARSEAAESASTLPETND